MAKNISLRTYAEAYAQAMPEQYDAIRDIAEVSRVLSGLPELASFLGDKSISADDKRRALQISMPDVAEETRNFTLLLSSESLLRSLASLVLHVKEACAEREDRTYAEVTSAVPLTNEETTRIASALRERIGRPILLEPLIDESIGGGIRIRIGDWVYDASVSGRLERLTHALHV